MKRIIWLLTFLVLGMPAYAADNVAVTPGSGKTIACLDISTVCFAKYILYDTTGAAFGVTGNPFFVTSTVLATAANQATLSGQFPSSLTPSGADGVSNTLSGIQTYSRTQCFNGSTWDRCQQISTGTAGTPSTQVLSVQGIGSMTPLLVTPSAAADPCMSSAKTNLPISQNGTSSVQLIALSGSTKINVCSLALVAAGATTVALTTGTGTACVTGNAAVIGTTTASIANSISLAANGGLTLGNGGGTVAAGAASSELCMILGSNVFVSGNLTYVQQ